MNHRLRFAVPLFAVLVSIPLIGACTPSGPIATTTVASVDLGRYTGTWYEIASVKQFFSIGLVNTTATYTALADGTIQVKNRGRYFTAEGPESAIIGSAAPVDTTGARLNVTFLGTASSMGPGNYWIVDLDKDYQWATVSDPSGLSFFLLSRTRTISGELKAEIVARAAERGVNVAGSTDTPQL